MQVFETHFDANLGESFKKAFFFATFCGYRICAGAHKATTGDGVLEDITEIDARVVNVLRAVVEILCVDEYTDTLFWMFDDCHKKYTKNL